MNIPTTYVAGLVVSEVLLAVAIFVLAAKALKFGKKLLYGSNAAGPGWKALGAISVVLGLGFVAIGVLALVRVPATLSEVAKPIPTDLGPDLRFMARSGYESLVLADIAGTSTLAIIVFAIAYLPGIALWLITRRKGRPHGTPDGGPCGTTPTQRSEEEPHASVATDQTREERKPQALGAQGAEPVLLWCACSIVIALGTVLFNLTVLDRAEQKAKFRAFETAAKAERILQDFNENRDWENGQRALEGLNKLSIGGTWHEDAVAFLGYRDWIRLLLWLNVVCALAAVLRYCLWLRQSRGDASVQGVVAAVALALIVSSVVAGMREVREYRLTGEFRFPTAGLVAADESLQRHWLQETTGMSTTSLPSNGGSK